MFEQRRAQFFPQSLNPQVTLIAVDSTTFWQTLATIPLEEAPFPPLESLGNYTVPAERIRRSALLQQQATEGHHEFLLLRSGERCVGWSQGSLRDSSTFFMAYSAIIRSFQRQGLYSALLHALLPYLDALGYERVTSNHMVNNRAVLIAKLKAGFIITGMVLDERYGAQVSLSYFFHPDRRAGFAQAYSLEDYSGTPNYQHAL